MGCFIKTVDNINTQLTAPKKQSWVVQSIVCFMSLLRDQLIIKVFSNFITKYTDIFVEKMREAFAMQKLLSFFSTTNIGTFSDINFEILTKC